MSNSRYCDMCGYELLPDEAATCYDCRNELDEYVLCSMCSGTGEHHSGSPAPCPKCKGSGEVRNEPEQDY